MAQSSRSKHVKTSKRRLRKVNASIVLRTDGSEEAIRAGERIALAAFSSGLKLAAAFGTVAAKTAGLALASLASGADKFSELVREEALCPHVDQSHTQRPTRWKHVAGRRKEVRRKRKTR